MAYDMHLSNVLLYSLKSTGIRMQKNRGHQTNIMTCHFLRENILSIIDDDWEAFVVWFKGFAAITKVLNLDDLKLDKWLLTPANFQEW